MRRRVVAALGLLLALGACTGPKVPLYTACNLWYEHPRSMESIGYKRGTLLPAGTPLDGQPWEYSMRIAFERAADGQNFAIYYRSKYHPGISYEALRARLLTPQSFEQLTAGLSPQEIDAIRRGVLVPGMSKRAVLIAYGYPPEHRTPSLEADRWLYWLNRTSEKEVCFDAQERTVRCAEMQDETL